MILLGDERARGLLERPGRTWAGEEVDVDPADAAGAELDVAGAAAVVCRRLLAAARPRDERRGDDAGRALGEDAGLGDADRRDVADRVDAGEARRERRASRPGRSRPRSSRSRGRPRERGAWGRRGRGRTGAPAVVEDGDSAGRVDARSARPATNSMSRSAKASSSAAEVSGEGGTGVPKRHDERDLAVVADAALRRGGRGGAARLARSGRTLERRTADADDDPAAGERREDSREALRAGDGVELCRRRRGPASRRGRSRRRARRRGRPPRGRRVRRHRPRLGIDRGDRLVQEPDPRLREARTEPHRVGLRASEHHVELRVAENERVGRVDQRHVGVVAELFGEDRGQFEAAEPRAEDQDSPHGASLSASPRRRRVGTSQAVRSCGCRSPAATGTDSRLARGASGHTQRGSYEHDGLYAKLKSSTAVPASPSKPRSAPLTVSTR